MRTAAKPGSREEVLTEITLWSWAALFTANGDREVSAMYRMEASKPPSLSCTERSRASQQRVSLSVPRGWLSVFQSGQPHGMFHALLGADWSARKMMDWIPLFGVLKIKARKSVVCGTLRPSHSNPILHGLPGIKRF